jgi:polyhydroxybutyrate depolymerase
MWRTGISELAGRPPAKVSNRTQLKIGGVFPVMKQSRLALLAFLVSGWCAGALGAYDSPEFESRVLVHGGRKRLVFIHFPANADPSKPKPVVLILHGGGGADAQEMARRTGLNRIADREGFIAAYPQGIDGQWNDGRGKTFRRAKDNTDVDDVGFLSAVIDDLTGRKQGDPARIYAMGLSNGGMMTYRLGIELGGRLAAIAAVIANLPENLSGKRPARPLPVLIMNGTEDPMMPWNGGPVRVLGKEYGTVLSTDGTVRYWTQAAQLPLKTSARLLEDRAAGDGCRVEVDEYSDAEKAAEVILYRLRGGGHNLPGGNTPDRPFVLGRKCMDIDGVEVIWSFFRKHSLTPGTQQDHPVPVRNTPGSWTPRVRQVGDPQGNYLNVEFTCDGQYMVWLEGVGGSSVNGIVWHSGVNSATGELVPPDGRGFRAFESTSWGRANPGCDQDGPYYIGADRDGRLILVRPDGPDRGRVTPLPTPPDRRRRAVYPTSLGNRTGGYVLFIQNEKNPGAGVRANGNSWVELQYISLAEPTSIRTVVRQSTPLAGFAPMDAGFVRWMRGRPIMTYGALPEQGRRTGISAFDADRPERNSFELVANAHYHVDPYPALIGQYEYIFAGIDGGPKSHVYRRKAGSAGNMDFELYKAFEPESSKLVSPSLAQSHEPFLFRNRLYTVYQVNDKGRNFFDTTFRKPGEIWLAGLSGEGVRQWLIAPDDHAPVSEPEPLVTRSGVWIYYTRSMIEEAAVEVDGRKGWNSAGRPKIRGRLSQQRRAQALGGGVPRLSLYRAEVPIREGE